MKHLDLFSGIGGFALAARWMGWETVGFCEIEPYAQKVLRKHWPDVPIYQDVREIHGISDSDNDRLAQHGASEAVAQSGSGGAANSCGGRENGRRVAGTATDGEYCEIGPVDIITGGFPCQDISYAGKGAGIDGERSGLWSELARLIGEIRPQYAVLENVAALLSRGLDRVTGDLAEIGYDCEWHCIPASAVGAPHRRDRVWIVAYPDTMRSGHDGGEYEVIAADERLNAQRKSAALHPEIPNPNLPRLEGRLRRGLQECADERAAWASGAFCDTNNKDESGSAINGKQGTGVSQYAVWEFEPNVGRVANGIPSRVDRLRGLGNAIVPQVAYLLFQAIEENPT